jgi:hypothetical protein
MAEEKKKQFINLFDCGEQKTTKDYESTFLQFTRQRLNLIM